MPHGWFKLVNFAEKDPEFFDPFGLGSEVSLGFCIMCQLPGSITLALGLFSRLSAFAPAFSMAVATYKSGLELAWIYTLIYVALIFTGSGRYSIDRAIYQRYVS